MSHLPPARSSVAAARPLTADLYREQEKPPGAGAASDGNRQMNTAELSRVLKQVTGVWSMTGLLTPEESANTFTLIIRYRMKETTV